MSETSTERLLSEIGFEPITKWVLNSDRIKLESLSWDEVSGWIYAFVVNDRVRYIGITSMVLRSRMDSYRDLVNDRVRLLIKACLEAGDSVQVYGLRRPAIAPIDLQREESELISMFETDWNVRR